MLNFVAMKNIQEQLQQIPANLPENSKVWIYQSNRPFNEQEVLEINEQLLQFYQQWHVHGKSVSGWAGLMYNQFIVFVADETNMIISGCSQDTTHRLLKSLEKQYQVQLFDRLTLTFLKDEKIEMLPFQQLDYALEKSFVSLDTLVFDNTVDELSQLSSKWLVPLKDSWAKGHVNI